MWIFPLDTPLEQGLVIPRAAIGQLTKIVGSIDSAAKIRLGIVDQTFHAYIGDVYYECRTLGSNFPDYKRVIPQLNPQRLIIDRALFRTVVDRVAIISDRASRMIRLQYRDNALQIRTQTELGEEAVEDITATMKGEGAIDIAFNADYVLDTLAHIPHPFVALEIKDTASPVLLSGLMDVEDVIAKAGFIDPKLLQGMVSRSAQSSPDDQDAASPSTARSQFVIMPMRI